MKIKYENIESTTNLIMFYIKTQVIKINNKIHLHIVLHGYLSSKENIPKTFSDLPVNCKTYSLGYIKNDIVNFYKDIEPVIPLFYFNYGVIETLEVESINNNIKNTVIIKTILNIIETLKVDYSKLAAIDKDKIKISELTIIDCDEHFNYFLEEDIDHKHTTEYKELLSKLQSIFSKFTYHQLDNVTESILDLINNPAYHYTSSLLKYLLTSRKHFTNIFYRNEDRLWNLADKPSPLLRFKNLFFMPSNSVENYISVMEYKKDAGKKGDDDCDDPSSKLPVGRKTPKACFGVIKTKLPKIMLDAIETYSNDLKTNILSVIDVNNLYNQDNIRNTLTMGTLSYIKTKDYVLRDLSHNEIVFPLIPSGLATKLYNQMDILYNIIGKYEKQELDGNFKFQDITQHFFNGKQCIVPNGVGEWLIKDCLIGNKKRDIYIELGKDTLNRNNLKALEKQNPKVYLVTHSSKNNTDRNFIVSYFTLIDCDDGIGVYCNFFTSKYIM